MDDNLERLISAARERVAAMTPQERAEMIRQQQRSYAIAEARFGSDADEAALAAAHRAGDQARIQQLNAEADARAARAEQYFNAIWATP